jgi:hypothetical protein
MVLPVGDEAAQQIGPAQERAVGGRGAAETMWLPPPVPVWRPSIMNFSVPRRDRAGVLVEHFGVLTSSPRMSGVDVDLDHAGIRRDLGRESPRPDRRRRGAKRRRGTDAGALLDGRLAERLREGVASAAAAVRVLRVGRNEVAGTSVGASRAGSRAAAGTHRRIARDEVAAFAPQEPRPADPAGPVAARSRGSGVADRRRRAPARRCARAARAPRGSPSFDCEGIDVGRQPALLPEVVPGVLVGGHQPASADAEPLRQPHGERRASSAVVAVVGPSSASQRGSRARSAGRRGASSSRRPSAAGTRPGTTCPGRSAGRRRRRKRASEAAHEADRRAGASCGPSAAVFHSGPSMSSIETKVGSPPIVRRTSRAQSSSSIRSPSASMAAHCVLGVRLRHARRFVDARHAHLEIELALASSTRP